MTATVTCPHCGKSIKLRDRSLLGKKGKCPACSKSFLLQEPSSEEVVSLELAEDSPAVGTGARWVPDAPPPAPVPPSAPMVGGVAYIPVQTPQGVVLAPVMTGMPPFPGVGTPTIIASSPASMSPASQASAPEPEAPFAAFDFQSTTSSSSSPTTATRRPVPRRSRGKQSGLLAVIGVFAVIGVALFFMWPMLSKPVVTSKPTVNQSVATASAEPVIPGVYSREQLSTDAKLLSEFRPTQGEPIPMEMLAGANNIVIHLRPDRIWGTDRSAQEIRECLTTNVKAWLEATIQKITRRHPQQMEELWIGISAVSKVDPPQISTVFRLKQAEPRSTLIEEFNGEIISADGEPLVTRKDNLAFHIGKDSRTIAICPAELGSELVEAIAHPGDSLPDGITDLLRSSDRDRTFTVLFEVNDVGIYADQLFEPGVKTAMLKMIDWLGNDAETVSWSLNVGQILHSELRVRPKGSRSGGGRISTSATLQKDFSERFPLSIEQDLMGAVRMMQPRRSGFRQIIGRFPAMIEAFRQATVFQATPSHLAMTTVLPAKAAPNLVLGTVLTWDESTRTNFNPSVPATTIAAAPQQNLPKTVMERLKTPIEVEFALKPLEEAFLYIGEETKVNFVVDGDALKMSGYTKNMPQTFTLGKAPGSKAVHSIFTVPMQEQLCLVIDDGKMEALITTLAAAQAKGLKVVPVDSLK
ncbi:MAG: hypothetical protein DWH91_04155 [Planctomycetota bacterium]|nr:MAG: hypothetical protein DWH91_04155 [Planctomycetota bacterium]